MLGWEVIPRIPIGPFSISPHGVGIAVGYFLGATLMARRARKVGFNEDHAWNAAVVGVLGAIVGARMAYIIGHSEQFQSPIEWLQIYRGGISLMGGLLGGFFAAYLYCRAKDVDFVQLADLGAPGLALGIAVGRIGDLVIGDHLGKPTDGFWGWEYQGGELISRPPCDPDIYPSPDGCIQPGMVVHQTALYDMIWALAIFFILLLLDRKPRPKGFLVLTWAALYSAGRIFTDFTRVDKTWFGTGLTGSQLTATVIFLFSLFWLGRLRKRPATADQPAADGTESAEELPAEDAEPAGVAAAPVPSAGTEAAGAVEGKPPVQPPAAQETRTDPGVTSGPATEQEEKTADAEAASSDAASATESGAVDEAGLGTEPAREEEARAETAAVDESVSEAASVPGTVPAGVTPELAASAAEPVAEPVPPVQTASTPGPSAPSPEPEASEAADVPATPEEAEATPEDQKSPRPETRAGDEES